MYIETFSEEYELEMRLKDSELSIILDDSIGFVSIDLTKCNMPPSLIERYLFHYEGKLFASIIPSSVGLPEGFVLLNDGSTSELFFDIEKLIKWSLTNDLHISEKNEYDVWFADNWIKLE